MAHFLNPETRESYGSLALAPGQSAVVGLWGGGPNGEDLVVSPNDPSVATVVPRTGASSGDPGVRYFALMSRRPGHVMVEARLGEGGPVWAYMQLAVDDRAPGEPLPDFGLDVPYLKMTNYLDNITAAHYDPGYQLFWIDHKLGSYFVLDLQAIVQSYRLKKSGGSVTGGRSLRHVRGDTRGRAV